MKRLLVLCVLAGMFVGGYYCGSKSIGIDLLGRVEKTCDKAAVAAEKLLALDFTGKGASQTPTIP